MADALDTLRALVHADTVLSALVGTNHASGRLAMEATGEYPRIVWVSEGGVIRATDYIGGRPNAGATTRNRQIRTDAMAVLWHIWGEDREAARAAMHALISACWTTMGGGACEFGRYEWTTQQVAMGEYAVHGQKLILSGTINLPVHEGAGTLTIIATQRHDGYFVDPRDDDETLACST